ncbi:MAG: ABC transporter substrate-binding protein [Deltaproteobacteria bacterium]|nr:ABC transporter substrate-binding protein [Deltaproteobacteria bacterium]
MRNNTPTIIAAILLCLLMILPAALRAQPPEQTGTAAAGATAAVQGTLDSILTVLLDADLKKQNPAKRMQTVQALFRQRFDESTFCTRALGRYWKERSQQERDEFVRLFSDLLVSTYLERIDGYLSANASFTKNDITYRGERQAKNYTLVTTDVKINQTTSIPVLYRMEQINGDWKVTDIAIEGISLLQNYRAQFNEIIANAGYEELIKRLNDKKV